MPSLILDLQTLLYMSYVLNAIISCLLVVSGRTFPGAWLWVLGQSLLATGTISDALPSSVPSWIPLVFGNTAYSAACLSYSHSVWMFRFKQPFPAWLYCIIPLQLLSFVWAFYEPYIVRTQIFSVWMALGGLYTGGLLLWKVERRFSLSNALTAIPFVALGLVSVLRLIHFHFFLTESQLASETGVTVWYVAGAILLSTITLFGYFMMTGIRSEQVLIHKDEQIEARNKKLMEAARSKDLFFAIVAHDLRAPIGGAARYVRKHLFGKMSGLEAKYTEVEILASSLEKTNDFLEKLLWWSKAQLADWVPPKAPLALEQIFSQSLSRIRPMAEVKLINISVSAPPYPAPCADVESVHLILGNLLSNAVKFSRNGSTIRIEVGMEASMCRIRVVDSGVGMDQATIDRLFKIEHKLSTIGTSNERGNGLGLILAQSLARRNNGNLLIESKPGVGTQASLWLPTCMSESPAPTPTTE